MEAKQKEAIRVTYRPGPGDPRTTHVFGRRFKAGETVDLPGEFANKARGNPHFAVEGEVTFGDDRPETAPEPQEEASFEDNQRAADIEEYGTDDPQKVDSLRRAREHQRELREAENSSDRDPVPGSDDEGDDEDGDEDADDKSGSSLDGMTVPQLRAYADDNEIDLGEATKKADIVAVIKKALK